MKIAVECHSPLLQKSLELFLHKYLSATKQCDIVVRDKECLNDVKCFYIANDVHADLLKPFSKSELILGLEKRYKELYQQDEIKQTQESMDFEILRRRIESLTTEYQENIIKTVKAFYEK